MATGKPSPYAANGFAAGCGCHYEATGEAASALGARSDGPERAVHIRIAEYGKQRYLGLADEHWRAVEIGPAGCG